MQTQTISPGTNDIVVKTRGLRKSFGEGHVVLDGIDLEVKTSENLVLLGRSGSGKSVIIKCIAGLIDPDEGNIFLFGEPVTGISADALNKFRIRLGFLFQNSALYDSMTVRENLSFPLKRHHPVLPSTEIRTRILEALESVGLPETIDLMPSELSGGMRKRIALARTIIMRPDIILYDEPTTGLDTITAREISELIVSIQQRTKCASIIITHDIACAKLTGDRLLILQDGKISAGGSFAELSENKEPWIRAFFN
jgi:phospholipid/cholesterol/gamma-HCH transport system ATP-binding protein